MKGERGNEMMEKERKKRLKKERWREKKEITNLEAVYRSLGLSVTTSALRSATSLIHACLESPSGFTHRTSGLILRE